MLYNEDRKINPFLDGYMSAAVLDNIDPVNKQRCRIRVDGLHDGLQDKECPWALRLKSPFFGSGDGSGVRSSINIGSRVIVVFMNNDPMNPLMVGELDDGSSTIPDGSYGFVGQNGESVQCDTEGNLRIKATKIYLN